MDLISQAEYARRKGVSRQAINKAIGAGKLHLREDKASGRKGIDPAEADRALGLNTQRVIADDGDDEPARGAAPTTSGLTTARTATEVYRARLAELEYNERLGKLRPIEQMELAAQRCGETVLRALDGMVGRAEDLTAQVTKEGVTGARTAMRAMVRDLRTVVAREFAKLASGELGDELSGESEDEPS